MLRTDADDTFKRALAYHRGGRLTDAEPLYRSLLAVDPNHAEALHLLGVVADSRGEFDHAIDLISQALALRETAQFRCNFAMALGHAGRHEEAVANCQRALALRPDYPEALNTLGVALRALGRHDAAEQAYRTATVARPYYREAWINLGQLLHDSHRLTEAEAAFRRALAMKPADSALYNSLALTLEEQERPHEALAVLDLSAALDPDNAETEHHRALLNLRLGRFATGWALYDSRFRIRQAAGFYARFSRPPWGGEELDGRTILLVPEQGLGDSIQFARYAPLVASRGGRVLLGAPKLLVRLMRTLPGDVQVLAEGEAIPPHDQHCPLMSLPLAFGTTLTTIPSSIPYLHADPADTARWAARLDTSRPGLRVGIVWAGNKLHPNDHRRSLPFAALAPLWQVPGLRWFSLQVGPRAADITTDAMTDLAPALGDFAETAAAMACLDLVISVDTAAAHLAGALGRTIWLLLPYGGEWRWLHAGDRSPWYPTMRLFRQDERRDWAPTMQQVVEQLRRVAKIHSR